MRGMKEENEHTNLFGKYEVRNVREFLMWSGAMIEMLAKKVKIGIQNRIEQGYESHDQDDAPEDKP